VTKSYKIPSRLFGVSFAAIALSSAAHAQNENPVDADPQATASAATPATTAAAEPAQAEADIVVTGTRTRSPFQAPTPTQVIGIGDLQLRGATNVTTLIAELPAFGTKATSGATGNRNPVPGQNFADLRGLGTARTLVLVDSHRFPPTVPVANAQNPYQVDLNLIPTLMLERAEVVTGGASALYGSDAVTGVVNLILRSRMNGIQGEIQAGISEQGDAGERRIGLVGGTSFAGGRGHFVIAADFVQTDGIEGNNSRDWSRGYWTQFTDPTSTAANGRPRTVIAPGSQLGNRTPGGLIVGVTAPGLTAAQRTALLGTDFIGAGVAAPFQLGLYNTGTIANNNTTGVSSIAYSSVQQGGRYPLLENGTLLPDLERKVSYGRADYEFSPAFRLRVSASYGQSQGIQSGVAGSDQTGIYNPATGIGSQVRIYADNPFIPASLRANFPVQATPVNGATPTNSFTLARVNTDWGDFRNVVTDTAWTASIGGEGELGGGWSWDANYGYGNNVYERSAELQRDRVLYGYATDVVAAPAGNAGGVAAGTITCRALISSDPAVRNAAAGCVPTNIFGSGSVGQASLDYFTATARIRSEYAQHAAQLNLRGSPFRTWAGPVAVAAGVEYRNETVDATTDARTLANRFDAQGGLPYDGQFDVLEGYAEATVPLARNLPFAESLAVNGAVRHARYGGDASASGGQTTWKVGGTWEPGFGLLLRAAHSLDIRSPSLYELDLPATIIFNTISYNGRSFSNVLVGVGGNQNLTPERARTTTFGGSFSPRFLPGFQVSVDYYQLNIAGAIGSLGGAQIALRCQSGLEEFCNQLTFSVPGDRTSNLIGISDQFINFSSLKTRGIDFTMAYRTPLWGGRLAINGSATYVDKLTVITPGFGGQPATSLEYAGGVGIGSSAQFFTPRWKGNLTASYSSGPYSIAGQMRFVGPGRFNTTLREVGTPTAQPDISPEDNHVGSYFVFNLSGTLDVLDDGRAQFFWVVNNLFDRDPNIVVNLNLTTQTNGGLYDVIGRNYRLGLRFRF
jgi:iron complex outermembrane receptor protein